MAMMEMEQVKDAALKYDKPTLARLAQSGQLSPTLAVMAGMMRDRIVQSEMKPPSPPTVAQEVMQPMGQRMGLAAAAQPQAPQQPRPQGQGLNQVPVPPQMFERQGMAGGGIVAFQAGGATPTSGVPGLEEIYNQQYALQQRILGADPAAEEERKRLRGLMARSEEEKKRRQFEALTKMGLRMLGTKEADFFTALGQAGIPTIEEYGAGEKEATALQEARQKELNRIAGLERAEKAQALAGATGQLRTLEERAYKSGEAEKERQAKSAENVLDRELQTTLKGLDLSNRTAIARMDIASKEKIANMPPEVIRGAQAIQKPGEDIGDAVERFSDITTKTPNNNTAKINAHTATLKAANEQWGEMTGLSGSLRNLVDAANGDKKGLAVAKKQFGVSTAEEASKLLESKRRALIDKRLADLPFSKAELEAALKNERQPGGARSLGVKGNPLPMPETVAEAVAGKVYMTSRGEALWNGKEFVPVQ